MAGLTLSGGIGWLRGTRGLSCDNIEAADVVLADGRLVHASETENPDLLWALKGGGGNFGVVVNFTFRIHPIAPEMMFCAPIYRESEADDILPRWRDYMATAPDEVSGLAEFSTIPEDPAYPKETWGTRVVALATVYDGPAETGEAVTQPLRELGTPLLDFSGRMPYTTIQTLYDAIFPEGPRPLLLEVHLSEGVGRRDHPRHHGRAREASFGHDLCLDLEVRRRRAARQARCHGLR